MFFTILNNADSYQNEENKREDFNYEQPQESSPLLEIKETHQSGINSFSCRGIHELDNKEANEKFLIASGGDDQALSCVLLEFSKDAPSVKLISKTTFPCAHRASITCKSLPGATNRTNLLRH